MKIRLSILWLLGVVAGCGLNWGPLGDPPPTSVSAQQCGGLNVDFSFQRQRNDVPVYQAYITDLAGQLVPDITRVVLTLSQTEKPGSTITLVVQSAGDGRYTAQAGGALAPGFWRVEMIVRRAKSPEVTCRFYLRS